MWFFYFSRVIKTEYEKQVMRYATKITCGAHKSVMSKCEPGMYEYQCEANFLHYAYHVGGCRYVGYNNICCSGSNGSILHYGHATQPNSKQIQNGDMWWVIVFLNNRFVDGFVSFVLKMSDKKNKFNGMKKRTHVICCVDSFTLV